MHVKLFLAFKDFMNIKGINRKRLVGSKHRQI